MNLSQLEKKVNEIDFLCLPTDKKTNCKFENGNSNFLYSLNEAIHYCEDQNVGQNPAGNSKNANLAIVKKFVQQFPADFNTLVMEIELLEIAESADEEDEKENKKHKEKLTKILNDLTETNDIGQMLLAAHIQIYKNELDAKKALINEISINLNQIKAIAGIFQQKFLKIRELISFVNGLDETKLKQLNELAKKTDANVQQLKIVSNLKDFIEKAKEAVAKLTNSKETNAFVKLIKQSGVPLRKEAPHFEQMEAPVKAKELLERVFSIEEMEATQKAIEDAFMIRASEIFVPERKECEEEYDEKEEDED
ncbi:hypothetical protein niasHT_011974 [Heterodera trifolii]|uniref:Uncharacterized protein n=1 Tax=Heterodera trifolii TaxID=157864 RepID=A0ABD2LK63_9BILA